jgi:3-keto-5-aminohexanoate cleavage enzyme
LDPLVVTVAGVGAELTREQQPHLPLSAEEIAEDAARCAEAGATVYHLHVRDANGSPTMDVDVFRRALDAVRARSDVIVQFSSGGAIGDREEVRIAPLSLRPPMASLTTGTVNFGDDVFWNPAPLVARFYRRMRELDILPEFEIFEPGMIANAEHVYRSHGDGHHRHFDFVLGVRGAMPAWPDAIAFLASHLPAGATWSATGIGKSYLAVAAAAIEQGGHVRTGFEDVLHHPPGQVPTSNAQLVAAVVDIARRHGRAVATPDEARQLLGLSPRPR